MGWGSGHWARFVAPRVKRWHCLDPSAALCLPPGSKDFGYSLGVLHYALDTASALRSCD